MDQSYLPREAQGQGSTRNREVLLAAVVFLVAACGIGAALLMSRSSSHAPAAAARAPISIEGTMVAHSTTSIAVNTANGPERFALAAPTTVTPYPEILAVAAQSDTPTVQLTFENVGGVPTVVQLRSMVQALEALPHVNGYVTSATNRRVVLQEKGGKIAIFKIAPADLPTIDVQHLVVEHIPNHVLTTVYFRRGFIKMYEG